jgi:hypothetical protein
MQGENPTTAIAKILPGVDVVDMVYRRRAKEEQMALRFAFDTEIRHEFLKDLAKNGRDALLAAGMTGANLKTLEAGRVPRGFQVHHIRPLSDNGTNDYANLVLIRAHPEHEAIHRYLDPQVQHLAVGEATKVRLPAPEPGIYGAKAPADRRVALHVHARQGR